MNKMMAGIKRFWNEEEGATAVEYGLMVALIAAAILVTVGTLGTNLDALFARVDTEIVNKTP